MPDTFINASRQTRHAPSLTQVRRVLEQFRASTARVGAPRTQGRATRVSSARRPPAA